MSGGLVDRYVKAWREEPKLRAYLSGSLVDDVGVAISGWASRLLFVALFTDQRERAKLMIPSLVCFLLGTIVAGPLADWMAHASKRHLARWRWRVVVWGRLVETAALGLLIHGVADAPTLASVAPYVLVSAFMKTTMRPTRNAFHVDLLSKERPQVDDHGVPLQDERGEPRMLKTHLLAFDSLTSFLKASALLGGLLLGAKIMGAAHGRYVPLFLADVGTNLVFVAFVFFGCHPDKSAKEVRFADLLRDPEPVPPLASRARSTQRSIVLEGLREVVTSFREAMRFLAREDQRPLLILLAGSLLFEWIVEFYDGGMIVKQVLGGTDEQYRHVDIGWTLTGLAVAFLTPALQRFVSSLGKLFVVVMTIDGFVIALAGHTCSLGPGAILPVAILIGTDHALTGASTMLVELGQNSASSPALRGRIAAFYATVAILGDIGAEGASTAMSERWGTGGMLLRIGLGQVAIVALLVLIGGRAFWRYGLRTNRATS
ncbi:MAG TPA: hypothetical protein VF407_22850 [Polyangiaceae bacterium]